MGVGTGIGGHRCRFWGLRWGPRAAGLLQEVAQDSAQAGTVTEEEGAGAPL